jgi:regulatory protein
VPTITKIAQQQRRKDRYSIYIDGKYQLSLSELELIDAGLRSGDTVAEEYLEQLQATSVFGKALDRAYTYIALRPRSRQEVITYFRRKDYDDELVLQVVAELERRQLLNDASFAATWVEERLQFNPRSRQQLKAELIQKGIAPETIAETLTAINSDTEVEVVCTLITTKHLLSRYDDQRKLVQYLATKGFRYDTIKAALEQLEHTSG